MNLPQPVKTFLGKPYEIVQREYLSHGPFEKVRKELVEIYPQQLEPYYQSKGYDVSIVLMNTFLEAMKNAHYYGGSGNQNHFVTISFFFNTNAIVCSTYDEGPFFAEKNTKEHFEQKKIPKKEQTKPLEERLHKDVGFSLGLPIIYHSSDFIYVDNPSKTLYLGLEVASQPSIFIKK